MINNILLVGLGNIGRRHLESLQKLNKNFFIYLYDKKKIEVDINNKNIIIVKNLKLLKNIFFKVVIIATTASSRLSLVKNLLKKILANHWLLEKPVEQSVKNLNDMLRIAKKNFIWVNTPRRSFVFYKSLKKKIGKSILHVRVDGKIDIGCNAIHFVDLVSFLTDSKVKKISTKHLNSKWEKSKREGYIDINGNLEVAYHNGVKLFINSKNTKIKNKNIIKKNIKNYKILIMTKNADKYIIDERNDLVSTNEKIKKVKILQHQSNTTHKVIKNLAKNNTCDLPLFKDVFADHKILLYSLIKHYNFSLKKNNKLINIT